MYMSLSNQPSPSAKTGSMLYDLQDQYALLVQRCNAYKVKKKKQQERALFQAKKVYDTLTRAAKGLSLINLDMVAQEIMEGVFDGISTLELEKVVVLGAAAFIERDTDYGFFAARLFLNYMYKEVIGASCTEENLSSLYKESFVKAIEKGIEEGLYDKRLLSFDLHLLAQALKPERDLLFNYLGIQTLYERYFIRTFPQKGSNQPRVLLELPQSFWMRVAMGLSIAETDPTQSALSFYEKISTLEYTPSTPTLFHSGTVHPQLSSCYLTTVKDDLSHIFKCVADNAQMSKWSGGIGNDWTYIRATGALVRGTRIQSQGVVPFLKVANDTACAINRSGNRRGATCAYLETWHYDIDAFLDLRRNTGDERRRTHDMNTAHWIPDLFMKRVANGENWTLFSPDETGDLHDLYGKAFEERYCFYEKEAQEGRIALWRSISAVELWRKMLTRLFETGHPWITFKDPSNIRSPQDHAGVIHSSNLCTEIMLNTSFEETAVCNLGSINLEKHVKEGEGVDWEKLADSVAKAVRMLDNVIDINFYPTKEGKTSNARHRPIGLGIMGLQDALYKLEINIESEKAIDICDKLQEFISWHAIMASSKLAKEKGTYQTYKGSKWDRGLLPIDTIALLEEERGLPIKVNRTSHMNWQEVRDHVAAHGMRNSNTMAIAPTATISNIVGCFPCIEPIYKNMYVKSNMSGEFTVVNRYLIEDLKKEGLWSGEMLDLIKYYDGRIALINKIPERIRNKYKEAFEVDPLQLIRLTAVRAKWIDQSQSHNVFVSQPTGQKLSEIYFDAWHAGLKSTYYLRTLGASQIEKSTIDAAKFGYTQKRVYSATTLQNETSAASCAIEPGQECESCQ